MYVCIYVYLYVFIMYVYITESQGAEENPTLNKETEG